MAKRRRRSAAPSEHEWGPIAAIDLVVAVVWTWWCFHNLGDTDTWWLRWAMLLTGYTVIVTVTIIVGTSGDSEPKRHSLRRRRRRYR